MKDAVPQPALSTGGGRALGPTIKSQEVPYLLFVCLFFLASTMAILEKETRDEK